ncbi:cytochrome C biogenesis protein [Saccharibacter sp. 17.LH.SD]|nr:cytochrome C biogenesis protein [Saccharibacter sp. 17.LH.SD]
MLAVWLIAIGNVDVVYAAESAAITTPHTRASLVTDHDALVPNEPLHVGLRLQLKPGWHTYWVNPGDAGDAPHLTVQASGAMHGRSDVIHWPVPERISEGGLMAYAYTGDVLLPQTLSLEGKGGGTTLKAHADWLVCAEVCVPEEGDFTLTLPAAHGYEGEAREASLFRATEAALPRPSPFQAHITPQGRLILEGAGLSTSSVKNAWFFPLEAGVIKHTADQPLEMSEGRLQLQLTADETQRPPLWAKPLSGVVVLVDAQGSRSAIDVEASPGITGADKGNQSSSGKKEINSFKVLLFAFLGGLVLNLMPCVFPVLAMKALSLVRMGGAGRRDQVASALFYTLGVVGSFFLLGAVMIGVRFAGSAAGWGFQFQSPGFVAGVCWLLLLMALNLLGVFQITSGRLSRALGNVSQAQGHGGDLLAGLLAVIVATPCTAPFMGVAIAGALSAPIFLGLIVFGVMGLGLAAPYIVIAGVPGVASRLPKPGAWMEVLKQFLAFPLLMTCVWLLWVATIQQGPDFGALVSGGAVLLGLGSWIYGLVQQRAMRDGGRGVVFFGHAAAILCVIVSVAGLVRAVITSPDRSHNVSMPQTQQGVEAFSEKRLAELRSQGRPVFVDMTASWCITCLVNERVALDVPSVRKAFNDSHVVILRGDWTNRDKVISSYLETHGRDGVPLYVYYSPHKNGEILPQILTPGLVLDVLKKDE